MRRICQIKIPMIRSLNRFKRKSLMAVMLPMAPDPRPNLPSWLTRKARTNKCKTKIWAQTKQMTSKTNRNRISLSVKMICLTLVKLRWTSSSRELARF